MAQDALYNIKVLLSNDVGNVSLQQQEALELENLNYQMSAQESIYWKKSRVDWLQLGDFNSHFFFAAMKQRQSRNRITSIFSEDGREHVYPEAIMQEVVQWYKGLLGTAARHLVQVDLLTIRAGSHLSTQARNLLTQPVTYFEIDFALHSINDQKAPGLDGFNARFFEKAWHIVKEDIYADVLNSSGTVLLSPWSQKFNPPNI